MSETPTPRTDAAMIRMERLDGDIEVLVAADFARSLERQRDALAEALRDACPSPGVDPQAWWGRARAALAALERGDGKDGSER